MAPAVLARLAAALAVAALPLGCTTERLPTAALPDAPEGGRAVAIKVDPRSQRVTVDDPSPTVSALWDRVA